MLLNGVRRTSVDKAATRIREQIGSEPSTAQLSMVGGLGYVPQVGHEVVIGHGTSANRIFAGRLLRVSRSVSRHGEAHPRYDVDCVDVSHELSYARTALSYPILSTSASSLVRAVIAATTPSVTSMGFTTAYLQQHLPLVGLFEVPITEPLPDTLDRLAKLAGATWYADYDRALHFFAGSDPFPFAEPRTLTANSAGYWDVVRDVDVSQVYTRVAVRGASASTVLDLRGSYNRFPVSAVSLLANSVSSSSLLYSSERIILNDRPRSLTQLAPKTYILRAGGAAVFSPVAANATSMIVVGPNVASVGPLRPGYFYRLAGQWVEVLNQTDVFSATASSIAYYYELNDGFFTGGRPGPLPYSEIQHLTPVETEDHVDLGTDEGFTYNVPTQPSGTAVQVYATRISSAAVSAVQSLFNSTAYGIITREVTLDNGDPTQCAAYAEELLDQGHPDQWTTIQFATRDRAVRRGATVGFNLAAPGESGGPTIVGSYVAQAVEIGEFDRMSDSQGPVRRAVCGAVRRPSLWSVLR